MTLVAQIIWQPLGSPRPQVRLAAHLWESCWPPQAMPSLAPGLQVYPAASMVGKSLQVWASLPTSDEHINHTTCSCGMLMPEDLAGV